MAVQESQRTSQDQGVAALLPGLCLGVALLLIVAQLALSLTNLKVSWDDGAITAAFARTLAETGRSALTPTSPSVEGYSSVLWVVLLTLPRFLTPHPDAMLIWMKSLSALFAICSVGVIYRVALNHLGSRLSACACVLLLALSTPTLFEIANGMEMNLAAFLLLILFHVLTGPTHRSRVVPAVGLLLLLLLVRFEMPFALLLLATGLLIALLRREPGSLRMRELVLLGLATVAFFMLLGVCRHAFFGEWMPNTVYAKRFTPYRDWSTPAKFWRTRLGAFNEPNRVMGGPILIACGVAVWTWWQRHVDAAQGGFSRLFQSQPAIFLLALGCFLFGLVFGRNWGYPGRMTAAMIPFLILAVVGITTNCAKTPRQLKLALSAMVGVQAAVLAMNFVFPVPNPSIAEIEPLGRGAESIREALGKDHLVTMIADVGGSALCCERLTIIDSGLLSDPTLGQGGWKAFPAYFRKIRPDVVETHGFWAEESHLYEGDLLGGYRIVASGGVRYFVRDDLYDTLVSVPQTTTVPVDAVRACLGSVDHDAAFSRRKQTCLVLNDRALDRNPH